MVMEKKKFAVDEKTEVFCSSCDTEQNHTILTVTKQGRITKLSRDACTTTSTFKSGAITSP